MGVIHLMTAVFAANMLTVLFVYGAIQFTKREGRGEFSWSNWILVAFPLGMLVLGLISAGAHPQFLDAVVSR